MSKQPVKIKEVIETLCQLFDCHGYPKIQAEVFRQAKFNQKDAILPLLELISSLLVQGLKFDFKQLSLLQKFNIMLSILMKLGYPRLDSLSCDELHLLSSQELLLAFGYLLVQLNVFGYLRHSAEILITDRLFNECQIQRQQDILSSNEISLDHIIRVSKQIEFTGRDLTSCLRYFNNLLNQFTDIDKSEILKCFQPLGSEGATKYRHKVSLLDLIFFENFRLQEDCICLLKKQNEFLKAHIKWARNEPMFWKWMATVGGTITSRDHSYDKKRQEVTREVLDRRVFSSTHVQFFVKQMLLKTDICLKDSTGEMTHLKNRKVEKENVYSHQLKEAEKKIQKLEEDNKKWFTTYLYDHFPDSIQLTGPKSNYKLSKS